MFNPTDIYYMITINCNQRCSKCSHWTFPRFTQPRLAPQRVVDFLHSISSCKEFTIVGGEPLLYKSEILDIVKGISDTNIRTVIITNGYALDKEFVDSIKNFNIHFVFSIDTVDREFWKYVRGCDSYEKVMNNFEYAFKTLTGWQISIQSVCAKETLPYLSGVRLYAEKHNVSHTIQNYISEGFEGHWTPLKDHMVEKNNSEQQCFSAGRNISIMQDGDVFTCFQQNWIPKCERPLGNLHTDNNGTILSSEYASFVINQMKKCDKPCKVLKCNLKK